jgi:hypothetical protein
MKTRRYEKELTEGLPDSLLHNQVRTYSKSAASNIPRKQLSDQTTWSRATPSLVETANDQQGKTQQFSFNNPQQETKQLTLNSKPIQNLDCHQSAQMCSTICSRCYKNKENSMSSNDYQKGRPSSVYSVEKEFLHLLQLSSKTVGAFSPQYRN